MNQLIDILLKNGYDKFQIEFYLDIIDQSMMKSRKERFYVFVHNRFKTIKTMKKSEIKMFSCQYLFNNGSNIFTFDSEEDYNLYRLVDNDNIAIAINGAEMSKCLTDSNKELTLDINLNEQ